MPHRTMPRGVRLPHGDVRARPRSVSSFSRGPARLPQSVEQSSAILDPDASLNQGRVPRSIVVDFFPSPAEFLRGVEAQRAEVSRVFVSSLWSVPKSQSSENWRLEEHCAILEGTKTVKTINFNDASSRANQQSLTQQQSSLYA